jgi:hypothetical protein
MAKITMTIDVGEDGRLRVSGPLHDKVLCYGLLEAARDVVREAKIESGLLTPTGLHVVPGSGNLS